jgi:hypothetical protein
MQWRAAQGPSRLAVAITSPLAPVFPGHALTALSTARESSRAGRIGLDALESAPLVKNRPGDPGELVGERDRQNVAVQALLRSFDPRLEPVALPSLRLDLDQHDPGGLNKQRTQITIATPRYAAEDGAITGDICFGTSPSQAPKSRPLANASPVPIAATIALEMIGPMPGTVIRRSQPLS